MPATSENGQYLATGTPVIANAYIVGGNCFRAIPSSPGRTVQFRAGTAPIRDERDLIACIRLPEVQVVVERDYVDWIAGALQKSGVKELEQANLTLPLGFSLALNGVEWELRQTGTVDLPAADLSFHDDPLIQLPDVDLDAAPLPEGVDAQAWHPAGGRRAKNR